MGKYFVEFDLVARNDLRAHYKAGNKVTIKKIEKILIELTVNPFQGVEQPEELKNNFKGYWSRRINKKRPNNLQSSRRYCDSLRYFGNGSLF